MSLHIRNLRAVLAIGSLAVCLTSGCRLYQSEECCPTDLRYTYSVCSNEAVRRLPCGPDEYDYGLKPTMWRTDAYELLPAQDPPPDSPQPSPEPTEGWKIIDDFGQPFVPQPSPPTAPQAMKTIKPSAKYEAQDLDLSYLSSLFP